MDALVDIEEKVLCPYNSSHHIRLCRMTVHLVRCRKNYPNSKLVECEFNSAHKIPKPELQYHHENCPDGKRFEAVLLKEEEFAPNPFPIQTETTMQSPDDENWDNDPVAPSYNPQEYCLKSNVLRRLDVAGAAKRKDFRLAERRRLNQLEEETKNREGKIDLPKPTTYNVKKEMKLPEVKVHERTEDIPSSISDLLQRIKLDKMGPIIPGIKK